MVVTFKLSIKQRSKRTRPMQNPRVFPGLHGLGHGFLGVIGIGDIDAGFFVRERCGFFCHGNSLAGLMPMNVKNTGLQKTADPWHLRLLAVPALCSASSSETAILNQIG